MKRRQPPRPICPRRPPGLTCLSCPADPPAPPLKAPFPYFGGKSKIASLVWAALGDVRHYIEPFFGSGAVLLARPDYDPTRHIETVCDKDGLLCNVWRAMQFAPDEVARWCDWPVNHADLISRRLVLVREQEGLLEKLIANDEYCDPKLAGYWVWAASCWIGSGLTRLNAGPSVADTGKGVHAITKRNQRPHLSGSGTGIHKLRKRPQAGDETADVRQPYNPNLYTWFRQLSERLRHVRVVCGDWSRVCGGDWQDNRGLCGMFLDPPYSHDTGRDVTIYAEESADVAKAVAQWAVERGDRESYRIVISGFYEGHEWLRRCGWSIRRWTASGGYANTARKSGNVAAANRHREALFFSPYCLAIPRRSPRRF